MKKNGRIGWQPPRKPRRFFRRRDWRAWAAAIMILIALASAALWLVRDAQTVFGDFGPDAGSLIVNINTGSAEELESVPGIGATRAAQIIAHRPYANVDELSKIAGLSGKTLDAMRPFLTVDGDTRKSGQ